MCFAGQKGIARAQLECAQESMRREEEEIINLFKTLKGFCCRRRKRHGVCVCVCNSGGIAACMGLIPQRRGNNGV